MLPVATLLTVLDSLAAGALVAQAALGDDGAGTGTVGRGAANNVATLQTAAGLDATVADLLAPFQARLGLVVWGALGRALVGALVQQAIDVHYGGTGQMNATLATAGKRVHPALRDLGMQIDAPNAFDPAAVIFGTDIVSAPGVGVYTVGAVIDQTLYGKANVVLRADTVIGAANIVATLTLRKADGTTEQKTATLPAGSIIGATVAVGTPLTDMYVGCTAVTFSGGTAADHFSVRSTVERTVTL